MLNFRRVRKKIGDLLIERGIIAEEQLAIALQEQKKKGGYLSQHLIALGFATELDIANCLSNQYNFAYLPLKNYAIPSEVLNLVPLKWIKIYALIPVDRVGEVLSVAMADPLNEGVIQMLGQITNCRIEVFISTYSEINETINRYFHNKLQDMEEGCFDAKDLVKIKTAEEFIKTKVYTGPERRQYLRIEEELDISYYLHGKTFQGKIKNISYGGICFFSEIFISVDTNLACKIYLRDKQPSVDVIINILRVQGEDKSATLDTSESSDKGYEIAGTFEFITAEDREKLVSFLKENIP